ncbi:MAG: Ig-like domain-containing protein [Actinomycetota bacterium]|nr:Ig-like domain-containing protein [Actinomycetota bacterium]
MPKPIPDGNATGVTSNLVVGGSGKINHVTVRIGSITHTWDGDLNISLIAPDGTTVALASGRGGSADNFTNTVFDDAAGVSIGSGSAPFTGSFRPESPLAALNGHDIAGTWKLKAVDTVFTDAGTINQWGLTQTPVVCLTGSPPSATTAAASGVTSSSATLNGSFDGNGAGTDFAFQLGATKGYGVTVGAGSGTGPATLAATATALNPGTQYHYRAVAVRAGVPVVAGADQTFTTGGGPAPPPPTISSPADGSLNSTGNVTVSGSAQAGSTVEVFDGTVSKGTTTTDGGGSWSKALVGVADGPHTYTAKATDGAGSTSGASNTRTVTVDTQAPSPPTISSPADGSSNFTGNVTVSGSAEAGSTVEVLDGTVSKGTTTTDGGGSWSKALVGVADGSHTYTAKATDIAGNTSGASNARTVTVDTRPLRPPSIDSPPDATFNTMGKVTLSGVAEAGSTVEVFDGTVSKGGTTADGSFYWTKSLANVPDGSHTYTARITEAAGRTSGPSNARTVTVDTHASPQPPMLTFPAAGWTDTTGNLSLAGIAEPGTTVEVFEGAVSKGMTIAESHGDWSIDLIGVADGAHTYTARATNAGGHTSGPSNERTFTVARPKPNPTSTPAPTLTMPSPTLSPVAGSASFGGAPNTVTVSAAGSFTYGFTASPLFVGAAVFETDKAVAARARVRRRRLTLGRSPFMAAPTGSVKVTVKLSSANLKALKKLKRLQVRLTVTVDRRGFVQRFTLKAPTTKAKRRKR